MKKNTDTTLTAWFKLNKICPFANKIKYRNIPKYFTFTKSKKWVKRSKFNNLTENEDIVTKFETRSIGRMNSVSPKDTERFHLKLILNCKKGAKSFKDLRTRENILYSTYKDAADAMGLIKSDEHMLKDFEEAHYHDAFSIETIFCLVLDK